MTSCAPAASAVGRRVNESLFCKSCCPVPPSRSLPLFLPRLMPTAVLQHASTLTHSLKAYSHQACIYSTHILLQQAFKIETMHHYEPLHTSCDEATFILLCMLNYLFTQQKKSLTYFWVILLRKRRKKIYFFDLKTHLKLNDVIRTNEQKRQID